MNRTVLSLIPLLPPLLVALLIFTLRGVNCSESTTANSFRREQDSLRALAVRAEQAANLRFKPALTADESVSPFESRPAESVVARPARTVTETAPFQREPLTVQGIMKGATLLAVLIDSKGNSHFVKVGESLFNRKVTAITSTGVTLVDPEGTEIVQIP